VKFVFLGNTNNYPHIMARALAREGHDVVHIIDREEPLHRPEHRYSDADLEESGGVRLENLGRIDFRHVWNDRRLGVEARQLCEGADLVVLNGLSPAMLKVHPPKFVLWLTGSDLTFVRDWWKFVLPRRTGPLGSVTANRRTLTEFLRSIDATLDRFVTFRIVSRRQMRLIMTAADVIYFAPGVVEEGDVILERLRPRGERTHFRISDCELGSPSLSEADSHSLEILLLSRLSWKKKPSDLRTTLDFKGTDIFLQGMAMAMESEPTGFRLTLARKGPDVQATEVLLRDLGMESSVTWIEEFGQKSIPRLVAKSDVVVDSLGPSVPGMATMDALRLGKPVITRPFEGLGNDLLRDAPILWAQTSEDVCRHLLALRGSGDFRRRLAEDVRRFSDQTLDPANYTELFLQAARN